MPRGRKPASGFVRLCRAVRETRRSGARDRVALRRTASGGLAPRGRRSPGARGPPRAEWAETSRSTRCPSPARCCSSRAPVEIEDAQDDERIPAELAADLGIGLGPLRAAARRPPGRHALDRAGRRRRRSGAPLAACAARGRRWAALRARIESERERARGRVPARADARSRSCRRRSTRCWPRSASALAAEIECRRATVFLLEGGRLVAARLAGRGRLATIAPSWVRLRSADPAAAARGGGARSPASRGRPRRLVAAPDRGLGRRARSRVRARGSARSPARARSGRWCSTTSEPDALLGRGGAARRGRRRPHRARDRAGAR